MRRSEFDFALARTETALDVHRLVDQVEMSGLPKFAIVYVHDEAMRRIDEIHAENPLARLPPPKPCPRPLKIDPPFEAVVLPPTDAEIVAAYEKFQRCEAIGPSVGGIQIGPHIVSMEFARAAWSRELTRRVNESAKRRLLPCQGTLPEDL